MGDVLREAIGMLRPGDHVVHYENIEPVILRPFVPEEVFAQGLPAVVRALEHHRAALLMEGRTGLMLIRDWRHVLRICTDASPEEEPVQPTGKSRTSPSCGAGGGGVRGDDSRRGLR